MLNLLPGGISRNVAQRCARLGSHLSALFKHPAGQDLAEYALLIALIVIVVIVGVIALGGRLLALWDFIVTGYPSR